MVILAGVLDSKKKLHIKWSRPTLACSLIGGRERSPSEWGIVIVSEGRDNPLSTSNPILGGYVVRTEMPLPSNCSTLLEGP